MTEKQYPELPTHFMLVQESFRDEVYLYTSDQMRAYVDADRAMRAASQDAEDALVAALIECDRLTESMRIWTGMGYHYHPPQARQIHDTARAAIDAANGEPS